MLECTTVMGSASKGYIQKTKCLLSKIVKKYKMCMVALETHH